MLSSSPISFFDRDTDANTDSVLSGSEPVSELDLFDGRATLHDNNNGTLISNMEAVVNSTQDKELIEYISNKNSGKERSKKKCLQMERCMSRNAINAREHRQRRKELLKDLEQSVDVLKKENTELKTECDSLKKNVTDLTSEVQYLKGVLANQSTLATILHKISDIPGLTMSSSLKPTESNNNNNTEVQTPSKRSRQKRCLENQENEGKNNGLDNKRCKITRSSSKQSQVHTRGNNSMPKTKTGIEESLESAQSVDLSPEATGICLHVSGLSVSVELCDLCSKKSKQSRENDHCYSKDSG